MNHIGWKLASAGAGILAGMAAERIISTAWRGVTGHRPPEDPENPSTALGEAVAFAVVTGVLVGVARVFAVRGTAQVYARSVQGPLPWDSTPEVPGIEIV